MNRENESEYDYEEPENEVQDDEIIGDAFRYSLIAFMLIALVIAGFWWFKRPVETVVEVNQNETLDAPLVVEASVVEPPKVSFKDITEISGIDFTHFNGAYGERLLPETMGGGTAFLDYDNDGDADLLLINGSSWPDRIDAAEPETSISLYANDGSGKFTDVSETVGLTHLLYGMGVAVADYDGDGDQDIYVTAVGKNRLFRNDLDSGKFTDVTDEAEIGGGLTDWSTSAAFFDADNDGDLDLFVGNYVKWSRDIDIEVDYRLTGIGRAYGPPSNFEGQYSKLFLNDGDGSFTDVSEQSGIHMDNPATGKPMGKALAVSPVDVDMDGRVDLLVANDTIQNFLFRNMGNGQFEEVGALWGVAFDRNGMATGAMGSDYAWYRNDESLAFAIGNFANEMTSFYVASDDPTQFVDQAITDGIGPASRSRLSFGVFFFDYDLDGRLDFLQANGHVEDEINIVQKSQHYEQPTQLFWNCGDDCGPTFVEVDNEGAEALAKPVVGRGATFADIDGDGDLDILVTQINHKPLLIENQQSLGHSYISVRLKQPGMNPDAIGARVRLIQGVSLQQQAIMPSRSYLSQVEPMVHFGLGPSPNPAELSLEVIWPDGQIQVVKPPVNPNQKLVIERSMD